MLVGWENFIKLFAPKLSADLFIEHIVEHGYFAEQFPACFSSKGFLNSLPDLLPLVHCTKAQAKKASNATLPTTLSTRKNDISRRVLSLPNPKAFLRTAKLMRDNWSVIQESAESKNSLSPITYIHRYDDTGEKVMLNSENLRESMKSKSDFLDGLRSSIKASLGFKYRLKVDIANCYNTMYTHSVAWAMCGKAAAKKYLRTKEPEEIKESYELADKLDAFIRFQKNNETNGIVVGPFTSRIFSEIILAAVDRRLVENKFAFRRYVDDYKFYFRTEAQAQDSIPKIERVLNEYGLHLNTGKTEIDRYPFDIISQMQSTYTEIFKRDGVFGVLNAASQLYASGEKGAYKYALKYINDKKPPEEDFAVIMSSLINILLVEPKYGKYVIVYLKKYMHKWERDVVNDLINNELENSILNDLQQETLVFMQIIKDLRLSLYANNLISILCCSNDFAIVIALDIWKSRRKNVIKTRQQATGIRKAIEQLSVDLNGEDYSGSRWFLIYELRIHRLIDVTLLPNPIIDDFFAKLYENKVAFYEAISRKLY